MIFAVAIGWLPLVLLSLAFNPRTVLGLLTDYPINARMLVGVPVLLAGQLLMESAFRTILRHIRDAARLTPSDADRLDKTLVTLIVSSSWSRFELCLAHRGEKVCRKAPRDNSLLSKLPVHL